MKKVLLWGAGIIALGAAGTVLMKRYPEVAESWLSGTPLKTLVGQTKPLYMWRNQKGEWQATDKPPADGIPYKLKQYPIDANILPSQKGKDK